jgi:endoglucanase
MRIAVLLVALITVWPLTCQAAAPSDAPPQPSPPIVRGFVGRLPDTPRMKQWGANVVRVFVAGRGGSVEEQLQKLRELGNFKAVIVGSMGHFDFAKPELEQNLIKTWKDLAIRLLPYRDVIWGYDLVNEPKDDRQLPLPPKEWPGIATRITQAIRAIDDISWIIYEVGPGEMFAGFKNLERLPDQRVIYSCHYYFPHEFTHAGVKNIANTGLNEAMKKIDVHYPLEMADIGRSQDWLMNILWAPPLNVPKEKCIDWNKDFQKLLLQPVVEFQKKHNVPIYIGEFSTVRWGHVDDSMRYLREAIEIFEENGWSWSYHCFRGWSGWDPEQPEGQEHYWMQGMPLPARVDGDTHRGNLLKEAFQKNATVVKQ